MLEGALHLDCRDVRAAFRVVDGGFCANEGRLTVSLEARPVDPKEWPPRALFCLEGAPLAAGGLCQGARFHCNYSARLHQWSSMQLPKVHGYFTFHAMDVEVAFVVAALQPDAVMFHFDGTSEDPNYYDDRARPAHWRGEFWLPRRACDELWIPS